MNNNFTNETSLYRKYRPNNFQSIIGQDNIKQALQNSIIRNTISHSYLFYGERGTGKTSIARIFGKTINCLQPINAEICEQCINCSATNANSNLSITEIDAASNNGIEEIRKLQEHSRMSNPNSGAKYKVYIIDEVHMLSKSAFNALLKTLEEPTQNTIFILITTEYYKIPLTILSRCQKFHFNLIRKEVLSAYISNILRMEQLGIDPQALSLILDLSEGCVRDALTSIEQLKMITTNNFINADLVRETFSIVPKDEVIDYLLKIKNNQIDFNSINLWKDKNVNFNKLIENFLIILKEAAEFYITKNPGNFIFLNIKQANKIIQIFSYQEVIDMLDIIIDFNFKLKDIRRKDILIELITFKLTNVLNHNEIRNYVETKQQEFVEEELNISNNSEITNQNIDSQEEIIDNPVNEEVVKQQNPRQNPNALVDIKSWDVAQQEQLTNATEEELKLNDISTDWMGQIDAFNEDKLVNIYSRKLKSLFDETKTKVPYKYAQLAFLYNAKIVKAASGGFICVVKSRDLSTLINNKLKNENNRHILFDFIEKELIIIALSVNEWKKTRQEILELRQAKKIIHDQNFDIARYYNSIVKNNKHKRNNRLDSFLKTKKVSKYKLEV